MAPPISKIDHETALAYAARLNDKQQRRKTHVRSAFFYRSDEAQPLPPATELLKNRSQNGLHLKMALFYLWAGGSEHPHAVSGDVHTVQYNDAHSGAVFGFPEFDINGDPDVNGRRRIANARKCLGKLNLVKLEPKKGQAPIVHLLKEDGSGDEYRPPGAAGGGGKYHSLPTEFWTRGWHLHLSGSAVVAMLVLQHMKKTTSKPPLYVNPTFRQRHFGFSADTWYKGANELVDFGIATRKGKAISEPFEIESRRRRYTYEFDINNLRTGVTIRDPARLLLEEQKAAEAL
tara:strand:+ start:3490 stop:4356 length:867 start_codon:yes stop_codon:yes gene_type:complete